MPEIFEELDRQADKWEPTAAAISLSSLGLPLQVLLQEELLLEQASYLLQLQMGIKLVEDGTRLLKNLQVILEMLYGILQKLGADILGAKFATALTKGGSRFLRSSVHKPDYYPKHRSPRVNAMRKKQVDVVLNQQKKEATKKLAKKGVRPSQGSYFTSKLNQELNRSYLEQVAKRNTAIANDVTKLSPKIQLPIQIIPNIIDIHAKNK